LEEVEVEEEVIVNSKTGEEIRKREKLLQFNNRSKFRISLKHMADLQ